MFGSQIYTFTRIHTHTYKLLEGCVRISLQILHPASAPSP